MRALGLALAVVWASVLPTLLVAGLIAACSGTPPPLYPIGHCSAGQVAMLRAAMTAKVVPAVASCQAAGNPEDCPAADKATEEWLAAREACR